MSEQVLPLPLSGGEIIKAAQSLLGDALRQDCYLNEVAAYETVQGTITIRLQMKDCGRDAVVERTVGVAIGPAPDADDPDVYLAEADRLLGPAPPNQVRQETDQPLPVLTEDSTGRREVRRVTYARPKAGRVNPGAAVRRGMERAAVASATGAPAAGVPDFAEDAEPDTGEPLETL